MGLRVRGTSLAPGLTLPGTPDTLTLGKAVSSGAAVPLFICVNRASPNSALSPHFHAAGRHPVGQVCPSHLHVQQTEYSQHESFITDTARETLLSVISTIRNTYWPHIHS